MPPRDRVNNIPRGDVAAELSSENQTYHLKLKVIFAPKKVLIRQVSHKGCEKMHAN